MPQLYDEIGIGYRGYRLPDPRIAAAILDALGDVDTVLNVGAGAGSYEPTDRTVLAVEPSLEMIRQRPPGSAPVVKASAMHLPFANAAFDASLAILTVHHWEDRTEGLSELMRVSRDRVVVFTIDPAVSHFWLIEDYFPAIDGLDQRILPPIDEICAELGGAEVIPIAVPHDCTDGFLGAYWRRPQSYLDSGARAAISAFSMIGDVEPGLERLRRDLEDGTWERRRADLLDRAEIDLGYRLVVAERGAD